MKPGKDPLTKEVLRVTKAKAKQPKSKKALLLADIKAMAHHVTPSFESIRDYFMLLLMTAGMLRESELVHIRTQDMWLDEISPGGHVLFVFIEKSKTDQARVGHSIIIGQSEDPKLDVISWFKLAVKAHPFGSGDYFFCNTKTGARLSDKTPCHIIKDWLGRIGIKDPESYGSHSCRRGGATAAAAAGIEERLIKRHGNWKSNSVRLYIDESMKNRLSVSLEMLK